MCGADLITKIPPTDNRERHVCPACGYIHYLQPKVAAGTILERDGRIALVKRGVEPRKGFWSFPCGFMEVDEDLPTTAKRETEEETGLQVELGEHLGTYSYSESLHGVSVVIVAYLARAVGGEARAGDDVTEVKFVGPDEIPWAELAFRSSREAVRDWLKKKGHG
jgi:ADP-ribose pyrophosphatase YjhB (NUDIX family)